ncbi:MAG: hypothetical protein ABH834_07600 [Candidatus Altiarchaeota archaeon]
MVYKDLLDALKGYYLKEFYRYTEEHSGEWLLLEGVIDQSFAERIEKEEELKQQYKDYTRVDEEINGKTLYYIREDFFKNEKSLKKAIKERHGNYTEGLTVLRQKIL